MGHHHELPLTGIIELPPNHWSTTMRSHLEAHGITHWVWLLSERWSRPGD